MTPLSRLLRFSADFILAALFLAAFVPWASATETRDFLKKPEAWFASDEAKTVAANILSYQSGFGGWPKNIDLTAAPFSGRPAELVGTLKPTFDNGATTDEMRFLARMFHATGEPRYRQAVEHGIDYILIAQYPTGGWPQAYPPDNEYHRHITFNDDSMVRLLLLLQETGRPGGAFDFLDADCRSAAQFAFQRGLECLLKCQIKVNGRLTAWCAQHDEIDLSPRPARRFELVSLSGYESVGIVKLLMSVPRPGPEVVQAVESAMVWLKSARVEGWRVEERPGENGGGKNFAAIQDPRAGSLWARFYDITTNQPLWSDMDGLPRLGMENAGWARHGYDWTGTWAQPLLEKTYPAWKARLVKEGVGPAMTPWQPKVRLALAGDSTVTDTAGWGFGFKKTLAAGVLCQNFARGGQSSKSFRDTGVWQKLLASKPDYVLIQFGHNDMPGKGPHRETDPATTYAENLRQFVREAREAGARPVLVTSLVRRIFEPEPGGNITGNGSENTGGSGALKLRGELAPYAEAARKVAAEMQAPLIDLYAQSYERVQQLGHEGVAPFEPMLPVPPPRAPAQPGPAAPVAAGEGASSPAAVTVETAIPKPAAKPDSADIDFPVPTTTTHRDSTHLNVWGSMEFGAMVARELVKVVPEAGAWVRRGP